ncbi:MAG: hypothetical protein ACJAXA_000779 [Candidatus Aldehydirespiratoraceae bacterium]|jgi:hypothetical protein
MSAGDGWNCIDGAPITDVEVNNAELWSCY